MASQLYDDASTPTTGTQGAIDRTFALASGAGEAWWWFGALATIKATTEQTRGQYTLVEILVPPRYEGVLHIHHSEDEGFYVLEGDVTLYIGEKTIQAGPGTFAFGPKDIPHAFRVGLNGAKMLYILSPAGFDGFIRESGEPEVSLMLPPPAETPPDEAKMQRVVRIAARYGNEIVGPTPNR